MPFHTTLGPYDYWAIEYAYKPMPAGSTPQAEQAELLRIAARSSEPLLAYGTDEDAAFGLDPETMMIDLGDDPLAFAAKRLAIARDLFKRQESRELPPERDYAVLRRSIAFALNDVARRWACWCASSAACAPCATFPAAGATRCSPCRPMCSAAR
jgi:hypothetical protein